MFVVSGTKLGIVGINRTANNRRSLDIGQPKFAPVQQNPNCSWTSRPDNFLIVNNFIVMLNENLP